MRDLIRRLVLKLTHRIWNREVFRILNREYSAQTINSKQLHELLARFDPTQPHCRVGRDY